MQMMDLLLYAQELLDIRLKQDAADKKETIGKIRKIALLNPDYQTVQLIYVSALCLLTIVQDPANFYETMRGSVRLRGSFPTTRRSKQ